MAQSGLVPLSWILWKTVPDGPGDREPWGRLWASLCGASTTDMMTPTGWGVDAWSGYRLCAPRAARTGTDRPCAAGCCAAPFRHNKSLSIGLQYIRRQAKSLRCRLHAPYYPRWTEGKWARGGPYLPPAAADGAAGSDTCRLRAIAPALWLRILAPLAGVLLLPLAAVWWLRERALRSRWKRDRFEMMVPKAAYRPVDPRMNK